MVDWDLNPLVWLQNSQDANERADPQLTILSQFLQVIVN